jgi:hypothetical protein
MGNDVAGGLAHGALGLVGAGSAYDPLGDLKGSLADANNALQQAQNLGAYTTEIDLAKYNTWFRKYQSGKDNIIEEQMVYFNNLANNKLEDINYFLIILSLLVIIIIFFLLIK